MARRSRHQNGDMSFALVVLVGAAAWTHRVLLERIALVALGVVCALLLLRVLWSVANHRRSNINREVDDMSGLEFERYVAELLRAGGFHGVSLTERYDYGVDIIAKKDGVRWGIQVKRRSGLVKANAVRQVVTGLKVYDCNRSMVITNGVYSTVARRLAVANNCVLLDRTGLKRLEQRACIL